MTNLEIGKRITLAREKAQLNKKELADLVQVHPSTIGHYEDGTISKIKMPIISSIARALHVNPMWILGKSDFINEEDMINDFNFTSSPLLSPAEKDLITDFRKLNPAGQQFAAATVKGITQMPQYKNDPAPAVKEKAAESSA